MATFNSSHLSAFGDSVITSDIQDQHLTHFQPVSQSQILLQQNQSFNSDFVAAITTCASNKISQQDQTSALFPSKTPLTPPSPADSGVVDDSKSELGNISQEVLHSFDDLQQDERVNLSPSTNRLAGKDTETSVSSRNNIRFQDKSIAISSSKLNESAYIDPVANLSNPKPTSSSNNCVPISEELAAIWSPPAVAPKNISTTAPSLIDSVLLQTLQQQQSSSDWSDSFLSSSNRPLQPPPGLDSIPNLQKQLLEQRLASAKLKNLQPKYQLRRSQSAMLDRPNLLNHTIQSDYFDDDLVASSSQLFNDSLASSSLVFSPWGSGGSPMTNSSLARNLPSASALSLKHLRASSQAPNDGLLGHPATFPPKLHRSISTPARNSSPMSLHGMTPFLDDNPFSKSHLMSNENGFQGSMGFESGLNLNDLDMKLSELMIGNNNTFLDTINQQRLRSYGKWKELSSTPIYEEGRFAPSLPILNSQLGDMTYERYSRKVFVGGLPPDIAEEEIRNTFLRFGRLSVDWPHKAESKSYFPPKGYAFLLFDDELSVHALVRSCYKDRDKFYIAVSSPTTREKPVQIRPWRLADSDYVMDRTHPLDPRKTVFVGGVPRPLRAYELALLMDHAYGGVCYAGIDVDPDLKYPKGAGRVAFSNEISYRSAISARFVHLQLGDIDKRVEVKPYVLDDQHCDECHGARCAGKFAPFFCANLTCLQYYCEQCWIIIHARPGFEIHKPMVKEGGDRFSKPMFSRW